ncbi:phage tail assembly protein, partial [Pseudomonas sp. MWU12-2534b]
PRISNPVLTEQDVLRMDPADLVKLGTELAGFLVPNSVKQDASLDPSTK